MLPDRSSQSAPSSPESQRRKLQRSHPCEREHSLHLQPPVRGGSGQEMLQPAHRLRGPDLRQPLYCLKTGIGPSDHQRPAPHIAERGIRFCQQPSQARGLLNKGFPGRKDRLRYAQERQYHQERKAHTRPHLSPSYPETHLAPRTLLQPRSCHSRRSRRFLCWEAPMMGGNARLGLDWAGLPVIAPWRGCCARTRRTPGQ